LTSARLAAILGMWPAQQMAQRAQQATCQMLHQRQAGGMIGNVVCSAGGTPCTAGTADKPASTPCARSNASSVMPHAAGAAALLPPDAMPTLCSTWSPKQHPASRQQRPMAPCPPEAKPMMSTWAPQRTHFRASVSRGPPTGSNTTSTPARRQSGSGKGTVGTCVS
jgi:hypothetical protein